MKPPISLRSDLHNRGPRVATCPRCGYVGEIPAFRSRTGLYFISIQLKAFHDREFLLCSSCKGVWQAQEGGAKEET